jgi:hypothetical protein
MASAWRPACAPPLRDSFYGIISDSTFHAIVTPRSNELKRAGQRLAGLGRNELACGAVAPRPQALAG